MWTKALLAGALALLGTACGGPGKATETTASGPVAQARPAIAHQLQPGELGLVNSMALPDAVKLEMSQTSYFIIGARGERQDPHRDLDYLFSFWGERRISASTSLLTPDDVVRISCVETVKGALAAADCRQWPQTRQALLTLYALGHTAIEMKLDGGESEIDPAAFKISDADIIDWISKCTALNEKTKS